MTDKNKPQTLFGIPIIEAPFLENLPDNPIIVAKMPTYTIPLEVEIKRNEDNTGNIIVMKPKAKPSDD